MGQGDHLRVLRGGGWEHAIDLGDRTVIRWLPGVGAQRCAAAEFAAGAGPLEVVLHRERIYRPDIVVARAFSRFSESAYAAMFRSSEQFAAWCVSGRMGEPPAAAPAPAARKTARRKPARATRPAPKEAAARKPARAAKKGTRRAAPRKAGRKARPAPRKVARKPAPKARPSRRAAPRGAARKARRRGR